MNAHTKNLQTAAQAKKFLEELVNLRNEPESLHRFWQRYQFFFQPGAFRVNATARSAWSQIARQGGSGWTTSVPLSAEGESQMLREELLRMRDLLREAWAIADLRRKEWKTFQLRDKFHQMSVSSEEQMNEPPPPSGMDYALRYLLRAMQKARVCENPECQSIRYFISDRRVRRFCSDACARPAQSEYKSKWWEENRERLSENRKRKYRESKKQKTEKRR